MDGTQGLGSENKASFITVVLAVSATRVSPRDVLHIGGRICTAGLSYAGRSLSDGLIFVRGDLAAGFAHEPISHGAGKKRGVPALWSYYLGNLKTWLVGTLNGFKTSTFRVPILGRTSVSIQSTVRSAPNPQVPLTDCSIMHYGKANAANWAN